MQPTGLHAHLETERYRLDALTPADAEPLLAHFADPEVTRYLDIDPLTDISQAREIIAWAEGIRAHGGGGRWAIRLRADGSFVGTAGFNTVARERASRAEIAYDLAREMWGRGVMREVLPALIRVGFVDLALNRLEAFVTPGNERSTRLLARHGFRRDGVLREYGRWRGRDWDQEVWSLLRSEWREAGG